MDPPEHTRFRRALSAHFSARAVHALQTRVGRIVDECLDGLSRAGRGADLVASFALPMPTLVICELLGVDYSARDHFQRITRGMQYVDATPDEVRAAYGECREFMTEVIREKRVKPDDALVSALVHDTDLTDEEILDVSIILLMAGLDTTTNMLGLGTFALLQNPKQWRLLRERPDLLDGAVEELLRHLSISALTIIRVAKEDFTFAGQAIKTGDTVLLLLSAANRDPKFVDDPDRLDITRDRRHHLAFGHGVHQCIGQHLARLEMRIGFQRLIERFPDLRLAVPAQDVPLRTDLDIYGVHALPVTW
ncbi:cytochrome P450 [Amycolatopsis japonica]|uniref:cytochrome P450 n=1 Tax=Amycolatopsis japonica TaxID=208439 RepID=UPI00366B1E94